MLTRIENFPDFFNIPEEDRRLISRMALDRQRSSDGMADAQDYVALASLCLQYHPKNIFEIGTFTGNTSDFFLSLLPETEVVSIAYCNPRWSWLRKKYNNSHLPKSKIGAHVQSDHRHRFTQLLGDSHNLNPNSLIKKYGKFDLVFIDGDHSAEGVRLDTILAMQLVDQDGIVCWHDANPKEKYMDVRLYLETDTAFHALATEANYIGGIAAWSREIETIINCP